MQSNRFSLKPLTLFVEPEIEILDKILHRLSNDWQVVSIGSELSTFLVTQNDADQLSGIRQWLDENLRAKTPGPVVCTDIDLLFHPALKLDPLGLFRQLSRFTKLSVLWPGAYKGGVLTYAQPEHHHYHSWRNPEDVDIKGVNDAL
ncbi:MAG: BREX-3 system P-loop-containing protein BrxF [Chloroflexota bacterium]|nr:BREX-3 system P-loop-containing protein BrxF [Chloroflexota bacterium]